MWLEGSIFSRSSPRHLHHGKDKSEAADKDGKKIRKKKKGKLNDNQTYKKNNVTINLVKNWLSMFKQGKRPFIFYNVISSSELFIYWSYFVVVRNGESHFRDVSGDRYREQFFFFYWKDSYHYYARGERNDWKEKGLIWTEEILFAGSNP